MYLANSILLLGTNGQCNLGDDILLEIFLSKLNSTDSNSKTTFFVNSYSPKETRDKHKHIYRIKTFHTLKEIYKLPFIIIRTKCIIP